MKMLDTSVTIDAENVCLWPISREGFVNQYRLDSLSADKKTMVLLSESIENIPPGWKARETYVVSDNTLTEVFNLAEPNEIFEFHTRRN